jgi:hypothetical protein
MSRSGFCVALGAGLVCLATPGFGQTNAATGLPCFAFAELHLRPLGPGASPDHLHPEVPVKLTGPARSEDPPAGSFSLSINRDDDEFYVRHLNLGLIAARPPEGPIARGFGTVFKPEEFRLGQRARGSCSILTAIKRRNPLCLLNPIFIDVSW